MTRLCLLFSFCFTLTALQPRAAMGQMQGNDWRAVASKLVERMALTKGERVFLLAMPGLADSLIEPLRQRVREAGGMDLGALSTKGAAPVGWDTPWTSSIQGLTGAALEAKLRSTDLGVMLPGPQPTDAVYAAMQNVLRSGTGRTIHFHWAGAYAMDGSVLPVTPEKSKIYEQILLKTNYPALSASQQALEVAMRSSPVRVTTSSGTDISFRIGDRPVTKQDGDASLARARRAKNLIDREVELPAGAIRVAPIEESVNGTIAFPASDWGGERVEGLVMTFVKGRVTTFVATRGRGGVEKELAQGGEAAHAFREFALGLNPLLAIPATGERW
ncbi:MAG: aminopeptidase, partial [Gemmatimonadaceae bacterium]